MSSLFFFLTNPIDFESSIPAMRFFCRPEGIAPATADPSSSSCISPTSSPTPQNGLRPLRAYTLRRPFARPMLTTPVYRETIRDVLDCINEMQIWCLIQRIHYQCPAFTASQKTTLRRHVMMMYRLNSIPTWTCIVGRLRPPGGIWMRSDNGLFRNYNFYRPTIISIKSGLNANTHTHAQN